MSVLDYFRRKPPVQRAFDPPPYFYGRERIGLTTSGSPSSEKLLGALKGWQAIAARAVADRIQSLEPIVVVMRKRQEGTQLEEELDDHLLKQLLDNPNPIFTRVQMLRILGYSVVQSGEAYWLKVRDRLGVTRELWPLPSSRMELIADPDIIIGGYVFHGDSQEITYQPDEVVRFWMPDPTAPYLALGNVGPQAVAYDAAQFADETLRDHYGNDATPKVALIAKENAHAPTPNEKAAFETDWRNRYHQRKGTSRGLPALIPSNYEVHEFSAFGGVVEQVALLDHYRDQILMANGVPRSILGDVVDANRAAAETNQFVFDQHSITPITDMLAATMTARLAHDFDRKLIVKFREFVSADKDFRLREEQQDLAAKVRTINKVLEDRGEDPVPWGDEPIGTFADVPYDPEAARDSQSSLPQDDPSAMDDGEDSDPNQDDTQDAPRMARSSFERQVSREWQKVLERERKWTPRMAHALRQIFTEQRREVVGRLKALERVSAQDLFDINMWRGLFSRVFEPIRKAAFIETAAETHATLRLNPGEFVFRDEVQRVLDRQGAALISGVNQTTQRRIARELSAATEAGESLDQVVARINRVFKVRRANAPTIARTEQLKATQAAQMESFKQSGVVEKRAWHTSMDASVRDSHQIDGQVKRLSEPFTLANGELAEAPGIGWQGTTLSAENAINCRCFLVPVVE